MDFPQVGSKDATICHALPPVRQIKGCLTQGSRQGGLSNSSTIKWPNARQSFRPRSVVYGLRLQTHCSGCPTCFRAAEIRRPRAARSAGQSLQPAIWGSGARAFTHISYPTVYPSWTRCTMLRPITGIRYGAVPKALLFVDLHLLQSHDSHSPLLFAVQVRHRMPSFQCVKRHLTSSYFVGSRRTPSAVRTTCKQ